MNNENRAALNFAYKTLDCTENSTNEEIRSKYKNLIEETSDLETKKMMIKKCYEFIMKERNSKTKFNLVQNKRALPVENINDRDDMVQTAYALLNSTKNDSIDDITRKYNEVVSSIPLSKKLLSECLKVVINDKENNKPEAASIEQDKFIMDEITYKIIKMVNDHHDQMKQEENESIERAAKRRLDEQKKYKARHGLKQILNLRFADDSKNNSKTK